MPLGDPPPTELPVQCARCGITTGVKITADGQPADFDVSFPAAKLMVWFYGARLAMAHGVVGVAVGACARCTAPLVIPPRVPLSLPCPHCAEPVRGSAAEVLLDQWTEPWAKAEGGDLALEYRLAVVDAATGESAGCAACGFATPAKDPSDRCRRCGAVAWVTRETPEGPRRAQLGVRASGMQRGRPFDALVPIVQGESMLRTDSAAGVRAESGRSLLGLTGVGCALVVGFFLILFFGIGLLIFLLK
jgi:hypothetical protein